MKCQPRNWLRTVQAWWKWSTLVMLWLSFWIWSRWRLWQKLDTLGLTHSKALLANIKWNMKLQWTKKAKCRDETLTNFRSQLHIDKIYRRGVYEHGKCEKWGKIVLFHSYNWFMKINLVEPIWKIQTFYFHFTNLKGRTMNLCKLLFLWRSHGLGTAWSSKLQQFACLSLPGWVI